MDFYWIQCFPGPQKTFRATWRGVSVEHTPVRPRQRLDHTPPSHAPTAALWVTSGTANCGTVWYRCLGNYREQRGQAYHTRHDWPSPPPHSPPYPGPKTRPPPPYPDHLHHIPAQREHWPHRGHQEHRAAVPTLTARGQRRSPRTLQTLQRSRTGRCGSSYHQTTLTHYQKHWCEIFCFKTQMLERAPPCVQRQNISFPKINIIFFSHFCTLSS